MKKLIGRILGEDIYFDPNVSIKEPLLLIKDLIDRSTEEGRFLLGEILGDEVWCSKDSEEDVLYTLYEITEIVRHNLHTGLKCIGCVDGFNICCDTTLCDSIEDTRKYLEKITGEAWGILVESFDNKVLFRKSMYDCDRGYLHFKGGAIAEMPLNCSSCYGMFSNTEFPENFEFRGFEAGYITDTRGMFRDCVFPDNFVLDINTKCVIDMSEMFSGCKFGSKFVFGSMFDTSSVLCMKSMFQNCSMLKDFNFGNKFDTSNVCSMERMFAGSLIEEGVDLCFDTSNVESMQAMFAISSFSSGHLIKFNTVRVKNAAEMFVGVKFKKGFILDFELNSSCVCFDMFHGCEFEEGEHFSENFCIGKSSYVFNACKFWNDEVAASNEAVIDNMRVKKVQHTLSKCSCFN